MKVGILTFHASHNYGSMLQAYALQAVLKKIGVESEIINFRSDVQKSLIPPPVQAHHPRSSLVKMIREPGKTLALYRKYRRFEQFLSKDLNVTEELSTPEDVAQFVASRNYEAIITGSDQIWNPACWDFSAVYLCDFSFDGKRIAYAPSMGSHPEKITETDIKKMVALISKYNNLATREKRGSEFLGKKLHRDIAVVLDPTLLLNAEDYYEITSKKSLREPYIFYYTPREETGNFHSALTLSNILNIKLVVTQEFPEYECYDNVVHNLNCGPREFLSLIKNAAYCIGNSFHLLAFSLIFHKEFLMLSRENDSRMLNILESIGLKNRLIHPEKTFTIPEKINYLDVDYVLNKLRVDSISFLNRAISK